MLGRNEYSRATSVHVGDIERRLRSIEKRLEHAGGRASATATQTADQVGEVIVSALSSIAERFLRRRQWNGGGSGEARQRRRQAWQ